MKKSTIGYKDKIKALLLDSHISPLSRFDLTKEDAIAFLTNCLANIRVNYSQIVALLGPTFKCETSALAAWLSRFDVFADTTQGEMSRLESSYGFNSFYLKDGSIILFNKLINQANSLVNELSTIVSSLLGKTRFDPVEKTVFIVHGHNEKLKVSLKRRLTKKGYEAILLSEMNDTGIPLFEKFEKYANRCTKAIILITNDDSVKGEEKDYFQARPNVFIEFGYFLALIPREDIIVICERGSSIPSDIGGVAYLEYDSNISELTKKVINELEK